LKSANADGSAVELEVPLTEEDFLHPQEEDQFMIVDAHAVSHQYLVHAIRYGCRHRTGIRLFSEHRVDWQVPGILPHGPDVVVFDRFTVEWNSTNGTLPVVDLGVDVVAVFEITSKSTRHIDLGDKMDEFELARIPYYLVVDEAAPNGIPELLGFRLIDRTHYREMRRDPALGFMVPQLALWFRYENGRLIVADEDGKDIPDSRGVGLANDALAEQLMEAKNDAAVERFRAKQAEDEAAAARLRTEDELKRADVAQVAAAKELQRAEAEKQRAELAEQRETAEKERAEAEKQRAELAEQRETAEKQRAEAEKQRADELARELAELRARMGSN